jgi:hypothetical protein
LKIGVGSHDQKECMGLLEYQAMLSLCDMIMSDVVLCTFSNRSAPDRDKWCGPSIPYRITPCWVTLLRPARRAAVLDQPSSLGPHCSLLSAQNVPPSEQLPLTSQPRGDIVKTDQIRLGDEKSHQNAKMPTN